MSERRLVVCDVETTGLDPEVHEIIQLSAAEVVYNRDSNGFREKEVSNKFCTYIRPVLVEVIDASAMEVNQIPVSKLLKAPSQLQVRGEFFAWWEEVFGGETVTPLGHNFDGFDKRFLAKLMQSSYKRVFHYHSEDTQKVASFLVRSGLAPSQSISLANLTDVLEIPHLPHDAMGDCMATAELYAVLMDVAEKGWEAVLEYRKARVS